MKALSVLGFVSAIVFLLFTSLYGIYLAFSASIVLGILVLISSPSPFIIGLLIIFFNFNLPQIVVDYAK